MSKVTDAARAHAIDQAAKFPEEPWWNEIAAATDEELEEITDGEDAPEANTTWLADNWVALSPRPIRRMA